MSTVADGSFPDATTASANEAMQHRLMGNGGEKRRFCKILLVHRGTAFRLAQIFLGIQREFQQALEKLILRNADEVLEHQFFGE